MGNLRNLYNNGTLIIMSAIIVFVLVGAKILTNYHCSLEISKEEYKRLLDLKKSPHFSQKIEKAMEDGKVTRCEYKKIMGDFEKKELRQIKKELI